MSKIFWNALKLSPVILGATLLLANRTSAAEVNVNVSKEIAASPVAEVASEVKIPELQLVADQPELEVAQVTDTSTPAANSPALDNTEILNQVNSYSNESKKNNSLAQVTSVSQFSDVQPTDWAFQALQSLVERYGCIAGYPDGTYRGNRALTRYEFAAGLNSCLDRVNELIAAATADVVQREDLATLQRLQEEFAAELATLRGRVDALEAQTAELAANQFSTTTKLTGEAIFAISDVFSDDRALPFGLTDEDLAGVDLDALAADPAALAGALTAATGVPLDADEAAALGTIVDITTLDDELEANTVFADRARLNFNTSFFGDDLLRIRLQGRNITPFGAAITGTNMTRLAFDGDEGNDVRIDDLFYRFALGDAVLVQIDAANVEFNDNVFTFNPAFESSSSGAISRFGRFNPIYRQGAGGTGLTLTFNPEGAIGASVGYLAPNGNAPFEGFGLFDGSYAALGQVFFRPSDTFAIGATYARTYQNSEDGVALFDSTGSLLANRPFGNFATTANHYGVEATFNASNALTLSGWAGYSEAEALAGPFEGSDAEMFNWAATLALRDFGTEGSTLGVIFGQPPKVTESDVVEDVDTSYHLEALYKLQLTDNIAITPGVLVIFNPENNNDNENIYVGTLRTTFTF